MFRELCLIGGWLQLTGLKISDIIIISIHEKMTISSNVVRFKQVTRAFVQLP
jgi:hypothetical protein